MCRDHVAALYRMLGGLLGVMYSGSRRCRSSSKPLLMLVPAKPAHMPTNAKTKPCGGKGMWGHHVEGSVLHHITGAHATV